MKKLFILILILTCSTYGIGQNVTVAGGGAGATTTGADTTKPVDKKYFLFMTIKELEVTLMYLDKLAGVSMPKADHDNVQGIKSLIVNQVNFQLQQEAADTTKKPVPPKKPKK